MLQDKKKSHKALTILQKSQQSPLKQDVVNIGYVKPVWKFYVSWGSQTREKDLLAY